MTASSHSNMDKQLTITELRKLLRSKKTAFVFLYVKLTEDDYKHISISKTAMLKYLHGYPGDIVTTATESGCDIIIG